MRRFLALLLALTMVLQIMVLTVVEAESVTTPTDLCYHYDVCTNPGICAACGKTGSGIKINYTFHNCDDENRQFSDTECWAICKDCGTETNKQNHWAWCNNQKVCALCGRNDVTIASVGHNYDWDNFQYDNEKCWVVCKHCGDKNQSNHYEVCTNPGVCERCGQSGVTLSSTNHEYDWENYQYDNEKCWVVCKHCGVKENEFTHCDSCINPGVCVNCGQTGVTIASTSHACDWENYQYNNDKCWVVCKDCSVNVDEWDHYDSCTNPGVCKMWSNRCDDCIHQSCMRLGKLPIQ